jgi:hypothetical protein
VARGAGLASAALSPFVASSHHDRVIDVAGALGCIALVTTMSALGRLAGPALSSLAKAAAALCLANYVLWRAGTHLSLLPLVQKAAFAAFLAWTVALALRVDREPRPPPTA